MHVCDCHIILHKCSGLCGLLKLQQVVNKTKHGVVLIMCVCVTRKQTTSVCNTIASDCLTIVLLGGGKAVSGMLAVCVQS